MPGTLERSASDLTDISRTPWQHVVPARCVARFWDISIALAAGVAVVVATSVLQFAGVVTGWAWLEDGASDLRIPLAVLVFLAFNVWNNVVRVVQRGASIGKETLGLRIRTEHGEIPGLGAAVVREVITLLLTPVVAIISALANVRRRTVGDFAASTNVESRDASTPPGVLRDVRVLRIVGQVVAVVAVIALLRWLFGNLFDSLDEQGIGTDFDFLDGPANFSPAFDEGFDTRDDVRALIWAGVRNTLIAAIVGIIIAVLLGTVIGIARLSSNWLVAKLAMIYVEVFRNIPVLVIIIFFGFAIFTFGPFPLFNPTNPPWQYELPGSDSVWLILSNDKWALPSLASDGNVGVFWIIALVGLVVAGGVWIWRTSVHDATGAPHHRVLWSLGTLLVILVIVWLLLDEPYRWSFPAVSESGRRIDGGLVTNWGYISITLALGLYTASHVAEIIRGSILAVPKGQTEASNAVALSGFQRYRFVILPQAMRIAIPPVINQFLNLTKNTSLGIAVAYAEITLLTKSSIGNGRPAVQSLLILMAIYLTLSFTISLFMNQVNRRFQLVGR